MGNTHGKQANHLLQFRRIGYFCPTMYHYFQLQATMANRHMREFGLPPAVGYLLGTLLFFGCSIFLFFRTALADYIYLLVGWSTLASLSASRRNDFLKICFPKSQYQLVRITENALVALPFTLVFLWFECYWQGLGFAAIAALLAIINIRSQFNFAMPTPFSKWPYEFTTGFRSTFLMFFLAYFITYQAVAANNSSLGIFALLLVSLVATTFYSMPEPLLFVWVYAASPKAFLWKKIKIALVYLTISCLPIMLTIGIFYPGEIWKLAGVLVVGYCYLSIMILAKYSAFPHQLNLPQSILLGISMAFPPFLLGAIPFFYTKAIKNLHPIMLPI